MFILSGAEFRDGSGQGHHGDEGGSEDLERPPESTALRIHPLTCEINILECLGTVPATGDVADPALRELTF